jgi:hypothetical protein
MVLQGLSPFNEGNGVNKLHKVLIANRGEIAVRILQACRKLGLDFVCVHTAEDSCSGHVALAKELGGEKSLYRISSYHDANELLSVADQAGATALITSLSHQNAAGIHVIFSGSQGRENLPGHQMGRIAHVAVDIAQPKIRKACVIRQQDGSPSVGAECVLKQRKPVIQQRGDQQRTRCHEESPQFCINFRIQEAGKEYKKQGGYRIYAVQNPIVLSGRV